jgi:hypothetical protein
MTIWSTYFTAIGNILWYIFPRFGILYQEKSGNPGENEGSGKCGKNLPMAVYICLHIESRKYVAQQIPLRAKNYQLIKITKLQKILTIVHKGWVLLHHNFSLYIHIGTTTRSN